MRNTPLQRLTGKAIPMLRANIDTDAIAPSRVKMHVEVTDMSGTLFHEWRFGDDGKEREDFILNHSDRKDSQFLIALDNFGCGSSRETAVWALRDYGFRCVIAPSFGSIFKSNCYRNGIAPVALERSAVIELGNASENYASLELTLDLQEQIISATNGFSASFEIDPGSKKMVMEGLDNIGLTLCKTKEIETFRSLDREQRPWVYAVGRDGFEP